MTLALVLMFVVFLVLLLSGLPIFSAIGLSSVTYLVVSQDVPLMLIPQKIFVTVDSYSLLAIPLFMLAGELMNSGGITRSILNFCSKLVGHIRGGLAHVSILTCMIFAGMCGSCTAAAASVGSMMLPAMREDGYDDDYSASIIASAAVLGPVIPPSIIMVIYASISGDSVAKLFMGGIIPGIIIGILLMVTASLVAKKRGYTTKSEHMAPIGEIANAFLHSLPALMLPIVIIVGIMTGVFTATEAGSVAVLYATLLGVITRELKLKAIKPIMLKAAKSTTNVLLLMATGATLGWILTKNQVPQRMTMALLSITEQPVLLMVIIIAFVLFLGCFLTDATIVPIITPLVLPVVRSIGYDPIAFGVILCTISVVGNLTPPVGGLLFVVSGIGDIPVGKIAKTVLPFLGVIVGTLVLCSIFPSIISFIPNLIL